MTFEEGDRVRVRELPADHSNRKLAGAVGVVAAVPDEYGRYGVRLDQHPRPRNWLHWFHPDFLEPEARQATSADTKEGA